jgi:hypothetical protein
MTVGDALPPFIDEEFPIKRPDRRCQSDGDNPDREGLCACFDDHADPIAEAF